MNKIKSVVEFLDGKKTVIGVGIHFIAYGAQGTKLIDEATFQTLIRLGDYVMAVGLGHKVFKYIENR